jgi:hypothetical protein
MRQVSARNRRHSDMAAGGYYHRLWRLRNDVLGRNSMVQKNFRCARLDLVVQIAQERLIFRMQH